MSAFKTQRDLLGLSDGESEEGEVESEEEVDGGLIIEEEEAPVLVDIKKIGPSSHLDPHQHPDLILLHGAQSPPDHTSIHSRATFHGG